MIIRQQKVRAATDHSEEATLLISLCLPRWIKMEFSDKQERDNIIIPTQCTSQINIMRQ